MIEGIGLFWGLAVILAAAVIGWLLGTIKRDVSIVDSLWSLLFLLAALVYAVTALELGPRAGFVLALVAIWSIRLSAFITWRNWGEPEDRRYQEIRRNNEPHFALKSLYLVFGFQGLLAWVISLPLLAAIVNPSPLNVLDYAGFTLWLIGITFEAGGDYQLARFKADPANRGRVMDKGLWRYTRHPNYFGDFCVWWGFYLLASAAGGWWTIIAPLLMTALLLRVSGVALLEKDIGRRRPVYNDYIVRTNTFIPALPKSINEPGTEGIQ
jgi:steroid 5-alpha reductase family enzyme